MTCRSMIVVTPDTSYTSSTQRGNSYFNVFFSLFWSPPRNVNRDGWRVSTSSALCTRMGPKYTGAAILHWWSDEGVTVEWSCRVQVQPVHSLNQLWVHPSQFRSQQTPLAAKCSATFTSHHVISLFSYFGQGSFNGLLFGAFTVSKHLSVAMIGWEQRSQARQPKQWAGSR